MIGVPFYTSMQKATYHQVTAYSKINRSHRRKTGTAKQSLWMDLSHTEQMLISTTNVTTTTIGDLHKSTWVNVVNNLLSSRLWCRRDETRFFFFETRCFLLKLKTTLMSTVFTKSFTWIGFFSCKTFSYLLKSRWYKKTWKFLQCHRHRQVLKKSSLPEQMKIL